MLRARLSALGCGALLLVVSPSAAQERAARSDELIEDPELQSAPPSAATQPSSGETIDDPELAGAQTASPAPAATMSESAPSSAEARLILHSRFARDLREDDPREEVWESTTIAALDATLRRSDSLRFSLGFVARYHYAALAHDVLDASSTRYDLDLTPSAGYVDASLARGLHVRAGYQPLHLGRFDIFSATNTLAVNDLREGPATLPEVTEVAQLSLLIDYDVSDWFSLRAIYVPFFTPHIVSITESDYALFPARQAEVDAGINGLRGLVPSDQLRAFLGSNLSRGDRAHIAGSGFAALAPPATFAFPQAALRASAHGSAGELALTFSTALEHLPSFRLSDAALKAVNEPSQLDPNDPRPISVDYDRFAVLSLDGALDVDRFSIGFELAYMIHRTLWSVGVANSDSPEAIPIPEHSDVGQLGLRIEFVQGARWLFVLEAFGNYAFSLPEDPRRGWVFLQSGRFFAGAGGMLGYSADFGLRLQLGAAAFNGPSVVLSPLLAFELVEHLELEVGALVIEGPRPPMFATPNLAIGGLLDTVDHVFVGLRYLL